MFNVFGLVRKECWFYEKGESSIDFIEEVVWVRFVGGNGYFSRRDCWSKVWVKWRVDLGSLSRNCV